MVVNIFLRELLKLKVLNNNKADCLLCITGLGNSQFAFVTFGVFLSPVMPPFLMTLVIRPLRNIFFLKKEGQSPSVQSSQVAEKRG